MDAIFLGNVEDLQAQTTRFMKKYAAWFFRSEEYCLQPFSGNDLYELCKVNKNSVGGLDGWNPSDWAILPLEAFVLLALLFVAIEGGAAWPEDSLHVKAAFLAKEENPSLDPLGYRILLIFPILYRRWAAVRLRNLAPWVLSWWMPNFFAGGPGASAEDAWWLTALSVEYCKVKKKIFTAGIADMLKCFDQIIRPLLKAVLLMAGMPKAVVDAYMRYHDQVFIYNALAGGFGKPYKKRCSIPQGCPFSMMFIALLMLPWVCMSTAMRLQPKVLADDIMLSTIGDDKEQFATWVEGFDKTHEYILDMGRK